MDSWGLNEAKKYFLVPLTDMEALYYIGNKKKMLYFEMANDERKIIAASGVNLEKCYLIVATKDECDLMITKMNDLIKEVNAKKRAEKDS